MRKNSLLSLSFCLMVSASSYAQVKIHDNGYISVQTTATPLSPISINCQGNSVYYTYLEGAQNALYVRTTGNTSNWGTGGDFSNYSTSNNFMVGVRGETRTPGWVDISRGRSFGIMGLAGYATSGWNYGVFGRIHGGNNGAAVYGTVTEAENGVYIDGKYAGYFNGNARVTGNLTVNGSVKGVVLTNSANVPAAQTVSEVDESENVTDKIKGLSLISYYKPAPLSTISELNQEGDTIINVPEPAYIEMQDMEKIHYGIAAEQLQNIYPELVYDNEDGSKSINYIEMIPLLLQSINELNAKISVLENKDNKSFVHAKTTGIGSITDSSEPVLYQNTPNPFSNDTSIKMEIPKECIEAAVCFYDLNGKQLLKTNISERGQVSLNLAGTDLGAGMFLYSLIVDNKVVSTKRMIVTK